MNNNNKVQLIGNLGNDPEIKTFDTGKLAKFSVATKEEYTTRSGERASETQWHNVIAWGKVAEIAEQYLSKGSEVAVEGKLTYRDYTDKDGVKRYVTEIVVNELLLLDKKSQA